LVIECLQLACSQVWLMLMVRSACWQLRFLISVIRASQTNDLSNELEFVLTSLYCTCVFLDNFTHLYTLDIPAHLLFLQAKTNDLGNELVLTCTCIFLENCTKYCIFINYCCLSEQNEWLSQRTWNQTACISMCPTAICPLLILLYINISKLNECNI